MAEIILAAETGRRTGSSASRRLRATGKIPAVVYGGGMEPTSVAVDWKDLRAALTTDRGLNALITLDVDGTRRTAVVKELQRHPVRRDVLHVDFLAVDVTKEITTDVPLTLTGEPEKVLREQGVVEQILSALVVNAKPADVPGHIDVDVSDLDIGHVITVGDLDLPPGVATDVDPEEVIATAKLTSLAFVTEEEEAAAAEAEAEEGVAAEEAGEEGGAGEEAGGE
ncbi:MAG: 50S ribosomal protein L25 [Acidimicrobiia bacterium]